MTNKERIIEAAILKGIYTPEEIQNMLENGEEIPLHTEKKWLKKGKKVKKDMEDKGVKTKLWLKSRENEKYFLVDVTLYSDKMVEAS